MVKYHTATRDVIPLGGSELKKQITNSVNRLTKTLTMSLDHPDEPFIIVTKGYKEGNEFYVDIEYDRLMSEETVCKSV